MMATTRPSVEPRPGESASARETFTASTCSVARPRRCPPASVSPAWCPCPLLLPLPRKCPQKLVPLGHQGWRPPPSGRIPAEGQRDGNQPGPGTSPLSGQPRAGCLSGREPSLRLGPNQQTLQSRCCGPKRMLSLPSACAPTASPGSPWLPPVASPPTSPRAGRATVALAGCRLRRWQKRGTTQRSGGGTRKVGCRVWKHFFRLVRVANRLWAAALTQPSPGHQGRRCPQDSKPRKIQAHENPHARAPGRGAAPRGNRGQCRGRRCTGRSRDRPSWGQGEWLSAKGRAVGVLRFGCCRTPGGGEAAPARRVHEGLRGEGLEPPHTASLPAGTVPGTHGTGDAPWAPWGDTAGAPIAPGRTRPFPSGCRGDALPSCLRATGRDQSRRLLTLPISSP